MTAAIRIATALLGPIGVTLEIASQMLQATEAVLRRRRATRWFVLPFYRRAVKDLDRGVASWLEITRALRRQDVEAVLRRKLIGRPLLVAGGAIVAARGYPVLFAVLAGVALVVL